MAGQCGDLADAANSLAAAGAAAMVAYAGHGSQCAGTLGSPTALPAFQARPYAAARLLSLRPREARIETHASPSYIYDLAGAWQDRVPAGAVLDGVSRHLASYVEDYSSLGGTSAQGHHVWDMRIGWIPWSGSAAYGLIRPVAVPSTVTHYESPVAHWERLVEVQTADGADEGTLDAPPRAVSAGQTIHDRWFGGPITARVSPLTADQGWQGLLRTGKATTCGSHCRVSSTPRATSAARSTSASSTGSSTSTGSSRSKATIRSGCSTSPTREGTTTSSCTRPTAAADSGRGPPRPRPIGASHPSSPPATTKCYP